MMDFSNFIYF